MTRTLVLLALLFPCGLSASEWNLVLRHGTPNADREKAWNGHVDYVAWSDDEHIVYWSGTQGVVSLAVDAKKVEWSLPGVKRIDAWSLSPVTKRLAFHERGPGNFGDDKGISVVNCSTGKLVTQIDSAAIARLLGRDFFHTSEIILSPLDGRLLLFGFDTAYGRNGFVLDAACTKQELAFDIDAAPREACISADGRFLSIIADDEVLCVRDMQENREVHFRGKRILKKPESHSFTIDAPFFSHLRCDGQMLVYTEDNSWATGKVFTYDLTSKQTKLFDARNGHIELDVHFPSKKIVLTGTGAGLTLMQFDGTILAHLKKATLQRNGAIAFSPSGKRVAVGSWDNGLYVYEVIASSPMPAKP